MEKFYLDQRMRSVIYRSESKIPDLYQQIEVPRRKRIAASLKIKVPGVAEAELRQRDVSPSHHDMLRIVLRHLDDAGKIGTVANPGPYFAGRLTLRWSRWEDFGYLGGRDGNTVLGLAFSMNYLIHPPGTPPPLVGPTGSTVVGAAERLRHLLEAAGDETEEDGHALSWAFMATTRSRGQAEPIEFVAKRLLWDMYVLAHNEKVRPEFEDLRDHAEFPVLLGSPLYLASTD
jgi:hypothetical protein